MKKKTPKPEPLYAMSFTQDELTQVMRGLHHGRVLLQEQNEISPALEALLKRFTKARDAMRSGS